MKGMFDWYHPILKRLTWQTQDSCLIESQIPKTAGFRRFGSPAEHSAPKGRKFGRLWSDSRFHLQNSESEANLLSLLRKSVTLLFVAKHQTHLHVVQLETSSLQG